MIPTASIFPATMLPGTFKFPSTLPAIDKLAATKLPVTFALAVFKSA